MREEKEAAATEGIVVCFWVERREKHQLCEQTLSKEMHP